jgi:hypothetical protein
MRANSIIKMLNRYGRLRVLKNKRIKYKEALLSLKAYQNGELQIRKVIDNKFTPSRSISKNCQLEGCNHVIRFEYVMENKNDSTIPTYVVGSTCVRVLLGLSDDEFKALEKLEATVSDFHDMIVWRKDNMDVWKKLMALKQANVTWYRPFWEEVEFCRLHPEDEQYIRSLDVDAVIREDEKRKQEAEARKARLAQYSRPSTPAPITTPVSAPVTASKPQNTPTTTPNVLTGRNPYEGFLFSITAPVQTPAPQAPVSVQAQQGGIVSGETPENYKKLIDHLIRLAGMYPNNTTLVSIKAQADSGKVLSPNQLRRIKLDVNRDFYETRIKGTALEADYNSCDDVLVPMFRQAVSSKVVKIYADDMDMVTDDKKVIWAINKYKRQFNDECFKDSTDIQAKAIWMYFRIKHDIILK